MQGWQIEGEFDLNLKNGDPIIAYLESIFSWMVFNEYRVPLEAHLKVILFKQKTSNGRQGTITPIKPSYSKT